MHKWEVNIEEEIDYGLMRFCAEIYRECSVCGLITRHLHSDFDRDLPTCNEHIMKEALE